MPSNRREFLRLASGSVAGATLARAGLRSAQAATRVRAIAFDGFPIFDPRPVFARGERLFPGHGTELANAWQRRIFEYTWLRTVAGRYQDFMFVIDDALVFALKSLDLKLAADRRKELLRGFLEMPAWPDVKPALIQLKAAGVRLAFLNNFTPAMLEANTSHAGLEGLFEFNLSVDAVRVYKPHPAAYQMGLDAFGLPREEILFAAFAGWDAAGAKQFGYPTFWVNRMKQPIEELGAVPDGIGTSMGDLVQFALG